jgi:hypothetical protein
VLYRVVLHAPAPPDQDEEEALRRVRASLEGEGLEVAELRVEDWREGGRTIHVDTRMEAPSRYHASQISGPRLFARLMLEADVDMEGKELNLVVETLPSGSEEA